MNEYRMTRPDKYKGDNIASKDLSERQGYYIKASSEVEAYERMREMFPDDTRFTLQVWKVGVPG